MFNPGPFPFETNMQMVSNIPIQVYYDIIPKMKDLFKSREVIWNVNRFNSQLNIQPGLHLKEIENMFPPQIIQTVMGNIFVVSLSLLSNEMDKAINSIKQLITTEESEVYSFIDKIQAEVITEKLQRNYNHRSSAFGNVLSSLHSQIIVKPPKPGFEPILTAQLIIEAINNSNPNEKHSILMEINEDEVDNFLNYFEEIKKSFKNTKSQVIIREEEIL